MAKRKIHIYWLQFLVLAIWVGVMEVIIPAGFYPELKRFIINFLVVMTGILAFEPIAAYVWKYVVVSLVASMLIEALRKVGIWYMRSGISLHRIGGPVLTLLVITIVAFMIARALQKDKFKV
ncbi:hypothetical protein JW877_05795 [bacterium]|nr:hypothetical protein [bacterium]